MVLGKEIGEMENGCRKIEIGKFALEVWELLAIQYF